MELIEEYIFDFHKKYPSCTPAAFASTRSEAGLNSYETLIKDLPSEGKVLDLACGDGYLLNLVRNLLMENKQGPLNAK